MKAKTRATRRSPARTGSAFIACSATGPRQWITLYSDGRVRLHAADLSPCQSAPFRTLVYRPKRRSDREAIRRVVERLNMMAAGLEGELCMACWCSQSPNSGMSDSQSQYPVANTPTKAEESQ